MASRPKGPGEFIDGTPCILFWANTLSAMALMGPICSANAQWLFVCVCRVTIRASFKLCGDAWRRDPPESLMAGGPNNN